MSEASRPARLPTARHEWMALLDRLGVRPSKGLGQNFLFERGVVRRMVGAVEIGADDDVLEIGPGLGILTEELLARGRSVTAIELDRRLAAHLRAVFGGDERFRLVEGDALRVDPGALFAPDQPYVVAANLPYAVASAVIRHLLERPRRPTRLALMLQKEVADRLVARPPGMSILGVAVQFFATGGIAFTVAPSVFLPPPKVESAVVVLRTRPALPLPEAEHPRFFRIVNAGFRQKRKQIANSMAAELGLAKGEVEAWLRAAGIDPMRRAQTLSVDEWVELTKRAPLGIVA